MSATYTVLDDGSVLVNRPTEVGSVDNYDPSRGSLAQQAQTWRGVLQGGRQKTGFQTRQQAVEWVISESTPHGADQPEREDR